MKLSFFVLVALAISAQPYQAAEEDKKVGPGAPAAKPVSEVAREILEDLRNIDSATDQFAIEFNKPNGAPVTWTTLRRYLKTGTRLYDSDGMDPLGNPYVFGTVGTAPQVSRKTMSAFDLEAKFWGPFAPKQDGGAEKPPQKTNPD